jgi:lipopolysaccharide/colanic/teichoic acid biosynthesis glycosyltransferase/glycosyltransferase involved in cell wall biosynthesis
MNTAASRSASSGDSRDVLHILLLDPFFRLPDQPASTRSYDIGRRLVQARHRVSVLTTTAALKSDAAEIDGMKVIALRTGTRARFGYPPAPHVSAAFTRGALWRLWQFTDVDAIVATDRPLAILPLLSLFCTVRGIPLLLDVREGIPPCAPSSATLRQRLTTAFKRVVFRWAARYAREITVLSRDMKDLLVAQKIGGSKIAVSAPGCDTVLFAAQPGTSSPALTAYPHLAQGLLVVYAGGMGTAQNLAPLLDLAAAVNDPQDPPKSDIAFAFCGDGPLRGKLEARALELGILNKSVWFLDPLPRRELPALLSAATAVIGDSSADSVHLFFDALAAGRPIVLTDAGWQRELIEGRGAGIGLPANDVAAAAREVRDFLKDSDGLRRANQQAAALAAGRFNVDRIAAEVRGLIEGNVAADPRHAVMRRRTLRAKRAMDIVISLAALIVLSPVFLAIAITIYAKMGRPVLFTQTRTGLKGKLFEIFKFRTMRDAKDSGGAMLPDDARLTPLGHFLRRASLDELPELVNILRGEMSLVGPRPLLPEYLPYYSAEQRRRHDLAPGLTGWTQVSGRNALTWEEKFARDVWYVDNISLWLDIKILFKTLWAVISGHGVSAADHPTMPRFDDIMARKQGAEDV